MFLQKIGKKYIAACMVIMMFISLLSPAAIFSAEKVSAAAGAEQYVTVAVEKFTLGQGYLVEPIRVAIEEGERVSEVITELLGEGNYENSGSIDNSFYLSGVYDSNAGEVNIPSYIIQAAGGQDKIGERADADWLRAFDYYSQSGWMVAVNNAFPNVGASDVFVEEGDVIRWQFSVYGWGQDLGSSFDGAAQIVQPANKDALTAKVAEINSSINKSEMMADEAVQQAYDNAYAALANMESSQSVVDHALDELIEALNEDVEVEVDKANLEAAIVAAELSKDAVKISTDGSDVKATDYWVVQAELDALVEVIESAQQLIADSLATQEAVDAKVLALNQALSIFDAAKQTGLVNDEEALKYSVTFTVAPKTVVLELYNAENKQVDLGDAVVGTYSVYTASLPAGEYRYTGLDANGNSVGGGKLTVTKEEQQKFDFRQLNLKASNTNWAADTDYTVKIGQNSPSDISLTLGAKTAAGQYPVLVLAGNTYFYSFVPSEARATEGFIELASSVTVTLSSSAQSVTGAIPLAREITFAVPEGATLFVGRKTKHFVSFEEVAPLETKTLDGKQVSRYKLINNQDYNYRVSQQGKLTNTGTFKANEANAAMEIKAEQLNVLSPQAILNRGTYLEGNIYLNINEQNHLKLAAPGDEFKLLSLRSWQALIEGINNYFFEPDYHYEIIAGQDVINIAPGEPGSYSTITAKANGTAIVKVTYDALKVNGSTYIKETDNAYSAIWPENVGLFVVTVGQGDTGITTGIESNKALNQKANEGKTGNAVMNLQNGAFDADIDSVYYHDTEPGAIYTFTPTAGSEVSVLRPAINHALGTADYGDGTFSTRNVIAHQDGSFSVLLTEGRNIVKVERNGLAEYQVMTARPLTVKIENITSPEEKVGAGDQAKLTFTGLSFPANKLSGIYNFNGQLNFYAGTEQKLIAGAARQYNLADTLTLQVPENLQGSYSLNDGHIKLGFFGSPIGDHRNIDPVIGANPNFTALAREGYYSIFPEIVVVEGEEQKPASKTALLFAADDANKQLTAVHKSTDGADIDTSEYWVTEEVYSQYAELIASAQALIADEHASQEDVDAKVLALNQSYDSFNNAKQQGKKKEPLNVSEELNKHLAYIEKSVSNPTFGTGGGEWSILSLARANYAVQEGYYTTYYNNVVREVERLMPETSSKAAGLLDRNKGTEHSRLMLGLTAIGKNIHDVAGYDISAALANFDYVIKQGINGPIFALIAFDSHQYDIPEATEGTNQTTRDKMIDYILEKEVVGGGWSLTKTADPDMTAMALQALAPYYNENEDVKAAADRAVLWLSSAQNGSGGYSSWGNENVQSVAQVIVALTSLGIDPHTDVRFIKNGQSALDNLLSFAVPTGGFVHPKGGKVDWMATDQATYALVAYNRLLNDETGLYNMTDVVIQETEPDLTIQLPDDEQSITIPNDEKNYTIIVKPSDQDKQISIALPETTTAKTLMELPANTALPQLAITRGGIALEFTKGIVMEGSSKQTLELITSKDKNDAALQSSIIGVLGSNKQLDAVHEFITIGGDQSINFTGGFVTLTFKGMKGKEAVFILNGQPVSIQKFSSSQAGAASSKNEYAYDAGNDLIVKTNHFTDFAIYSVKSNSGNGGGSVPQPETSTIELSIDKLTIGKGYVLSSTTVEFTTGESVWDVLKRELDARSIAYEYSYTEKYNSVYVASIAGDGEFDHGSGSGWMYNVNGKYPNYGVSQYKLKQGDKVQLRYTTNLGVDLGQDPSEWEENQGNEGNGGNQGNQGNQGTDGGNQGTGEGNGESEPGKEQKPLSDFYKDSADVSSWAYDLVLEATEKGFVVGYGGKLNSQQNMTRAEFSKLIVEVFNLSTKNEKTASFRDVEAKNWFYPYVNAAYAAGIVTGYKDQFLPNDTITREEMAVMITRALGRKPAQANKLYQDSDKIATWAQGAVADLTALNIMIGSDNRFNPKGTATREMAIVVAMRALQFKDSQNAN